jgi:hypothetical protein
MNTTTATTTTVAAPLNYLARILPALATLTDPKRPHLAAIHLEPATDDTGARLTVTDSYRLAEVTPTGDHYTHTGPAILLDAHTLAAALKAANKATPRDRRSSPATITAYPTGTYLDTPNGRTNLETVPGPYPRTETLWPTATGPQPFQPTGLNPELLAGLADALATITLGAPLILDHYNGPTRPIYMSTRTDDTATRALLMPQRLPATK